jgi:hypothetical protein
VADIVTEVAGPLGGLVLAVTGLAALWRQHREDDKNRITAALEALHYEREQKREAEARLDGLGETLKAATGVMEKAVTTTDRVVDILAARREASKARAGGQRHGDE